MLIIATSEKGGSGRTVTSTNLAYRRALAGHDVCYVDLNIESATAGSVFAVPGFEKGSTESSGMSAYLLDRSTSPVNIDVWDRALLSRPTGSGRLVLLPGDEGGGEFPASAAVIDRCIDLLIGLEGEFDLTLVDVSSGRSYAVEMMLAATLSGPLRNVDSRWMVFHRWTRQHIEAAAGLVFGKHGILATARERGCPPDRFLSQVRFVRTAVLDGSFVETEASAAQRDHLAAVNRQLKDLAVSSLGQDDDAWRVPLDPVLQWSEEILTQDTVSRIPVVAGTISAFTRISDAMMDPDWSHR